MVYNGTYLAQGPAGQYAAYQTGTAGQGALCRALVSSGAGGYWAILDGGGATVFTTAGTSQPVVDTLPSGASLAQGTNLYSANGYYYLVPQVGRSPVIWPHAARAPRQVCSVRGARGGPRWCSVSNI